MFDFLFVLTSGNLVVFGLLLVSLALVYYNITFECASWSRQLDNLSSAFFYLNCQNSSQENNQNPLFENYKSPTLIDFPILHPFGWKIIYLARKLVERSASGWWITKIGETKIGDKENLTVESAYF